SPRSARREGISASVLSSAANPAASSAHITEKTCWLASTLTPVWASWEDWEAWPRVAGVTAAPNTIMMPAARIRCAENCRKYFGMMKLLTGLVRKMHEDSKWQLGQSQGSRGE